MRSSLPLLLWMAACTGAPVPATCDAICDDLAGSCGFEAFPDADSCRQGCAYEAEQGAALDTFDLCLVDADCDTFEVLRCARNFGYQP